MIKVDVKASCEKIVKKCEDANLSAKQLQEQLNVTVTSPYIWLNGKGLPKLDTLLNLCELLNCTITDLIVVAQTDEPEVEPTLLDQYYYNKEGRKECWEEMMDINPAGTAIFDLWNAYKYLYRAGSKADNSKEQDLKKAKNYIEHAQTVRDECIFSEEEEAIYNSMEKVLNKIQNNA